MTTNLWDQLRDVVLHREDSHIDEAPNIVRRRRIVVAVTMVVGAVFLALSLSTKPGDSVFYVYTVALAAVWFIGSALARPLHLGRVTWRGHRRRPVLTGIGFGLALGGIFVLGGLVVREIPVIRDLVRHVMEHATQGNLTVVIIIALVNGVAEELFFRGALYSALGRHNPVIYSTLIYAVVTMASGNPMLGFAAILLGWVCAMGRRATDGVLAPILTHVAWSSVILLALPPLFGV
ncbi:CPBP family intramembrane glutamic endopeptidase [Williamsia sp. CHRR-6]|uniref:CPBP family intramembrane glutamic endopeptidase n=1 Tax=Williamsia sp. CHRR-6 TaxID=2835871 RepID=UPI001BDA39B0|nr:CPBP family intramembrane glutamic endopeptidase [Williamsia sp. CHRR-6]MBT0567373.1 CPBP family intramembrane metalloprotease [Williamsia sp. CHRR-6]